MKNTENTNVVRSSSETEQSRARKWLAFLLLIVLLLFFLLLFLKNCSTSTISSPEIWSLQDKVDPGIVTLTGTGSPGSTVAVNLNDARIGKVPVDSQGRWTVKTGNLGPGTYTVQAQVLDGNDVQLAESLPINFSIDAPPIVAPTLILPTDDFKPGVIPLTGTGTPGSTVAVDLNDTQIGTTQVNDQGKWSMETDELVPGKYTVTARALDSNGVQQAASSAVEFTINTPLITPILALPEDDFKPGINTLAGTGTPGSTVAVDLNGQQIGMTDVDDLGKWTLQTGELEPGEYSLVAHSLDNDGNRQQSSEPIHFSIAAPPEKSPAQLTLNGPLQLGEFTPVQNGASSSQISWSGSGEPDATVWITAGTNDIASTIIGEDGTWAVKTTLSLQPETYDLLARMSTGDGKELGVSSLESLVVPDLKKIAEQALQESLNRILGLNKIEFEVSKDIITAGGKEVLDTVAKELAGFPSIKVEIGGHTDSSGSATGNQILSEKRAQAVKRYLVGTNIDADRLTAVGYGEGKPLVDNSTSENKRKNRRVELNIISDS